MKLDKEHSRALVDAGHRADLHSAQLRTLEAVFRHPVASNLEWRDVVELVGHLGSIADRGGGEFDVNVGGHYLLMHKPHTKDLTGPEVVELRHLLQEAGWSPEAASPAS